MGFNPFAGSGNGGGGSGTDNYNSLSNKPQINGTVLSGNKTSDNLGLQNKISTTNKINSDFVDDENSTNKFMSEAEKTKLASLVNYDDTELKEDISDIETSLNNKVDKVNGKGLSTNDFTNEYKAQITTNKNGIAVVANAGAKNKLASTLDLAYLKSINRSGTWVDNVYTLDSISFTVNVDGTILVNGTPSVQVAFLLIGKSRLAKDIAAGNYILSGCPSGGGSGSNYRVFAYNPSSTVGGATDVGNGVEVHCDYSHSKEANIAIVIGANKTVDALLFSPMLRDASIEDSTYVPYGMTNAELTAKEDQLENDISLLAMHKVYSSVRNTSTSHTYAMQTSDFNGSQVGTYLITIVTWSTTPSFSLYAASYSGNQIAVTNLTKIAGADANISLTDGVISCTTSGKIQIIAVR